MTTSADVEAPICVQRFVDAAIAGRSAQAQRIVRETVARVGPIGTIEQLLAPAQIHVGDQWLAATVTSADEHRVSAAVDAALDQLEGSLGSTDVGPALGVSTGVGDWHATAARMAVPRLRAVGWNARFLGVSFDADRLEESRALGPIRAVALSCVAAPNLVGVARSIRLAHAAHLPVMVGGQAFDADPRRARRLGADAGPGLHPPPGTERAPWPVAETEPAVDARLDALLELDLALVTRHLREALDGTPIAADAQLGAALLRPSVDAWASAVAVDEPDIVAAQLVWTGNYLAARGEPADLVKALAAGMQAVVPVDPGHVLRAAAT